MSAVLGLPARKESHKLMYAMQNHDNALVFQDGNKRLRVAFVNAAIARITCTEGRAFGDAPEPDCHCAVKLHRLRSAGAER